MFHFPMQEEHDRPNVNIITKQSEATTLSYNHTDFTKLQSEIMLRSSQYTPNACSASATSPSDVAVVIVA